MKSTCTFFLAILVFVPCCQAQTAAPTPDGAGKAIRGNRESESSAATGAATETRAGLDAIAQARAGLKAAEAAHPGNSKEICDALEALIGLQLDGRLVTDETMALAQREIAVAEAGPGGTAPNMPPPSAKWRRCWWLLTDQAKRGPMLKRR